MPIYRTIREQIADRIRSDVLSRQLPEGTSLREQALAKQYGVSRAPIRDALLQLTQEGLLEAKPNCGVRVGAAPSEAIQPLIVDLRRRIEVFALRQSFPRLTDEHIDHLQETVDGLGTCCAREDLSGIVYNDMALHRYLLEMAQDDDLISIWLPIVSRMMLHYSRHHDWMESHREHQAIVDAIRGRDKRTAVSALETNIQ